MYKLILVICTWLLFAAPSHGQPQPRTEWEVIVSDSGYTEINSTDVYVDASGNIYVAATGLSSIGDYDILLAKYNSNGNKLWFKSYPGDEFGVQQSHDILADSNGDLYLTSSRVSGLDLCSNVTKVNSDGDIIWDQSFNETCGSISVSAWQLDSFGNLFLCGSMGEDSHVQQWAVAKYDSDGTFVWLRSAATEPFMYVRAVQMAADSQGNLYVTGHTKIDSSTGITTIKFSSAGDELWRRDFPSVLYARDEGRSIKVDNQGNIIVLAQLMISSEAPIDNDILLIKYDPSGDTLWVRQYDPNPGKSCFVGMMALDDSDNIVLGATVNVGFDWTAGGDWAVIKYSSAGDFLWQDIVDGPAHLIDGPGHLQITANGEIFAAGLIDRDIDVLASDMHIRKYSPDGIIRWTKTYSGEGGTAEWVSGANKTQPGGLVVIGSSEGVGDPTSFIFKYSDYVCGDADGSGIVTISDAVLLINHIFAGGAAPVPLAASDADCSGMVTISDAVYLINYIFSGGAAPCAACP